MAETTLTPEQRTLRARAAAYARWAREDGREQSRRMQDGFLRKFYDQTDPDLPEAERWRRAECARRSHMARLSLASSKARAARKGGASR